MKDANHEKTKPVTYKGPFKKHSDILNAIKAGHTVGFALDDKVEMKIKKGELFAVKRLFWKPLQDSITFNIAHWYIKEFAESKEPTKIKKSYAKIYNYPVTDHLSTLTNWSHNNAERY